jgi:proline iminopeptidase
VIARHEIGPASGRPLLVVHGGPGETHHVLRPHLDALASADRRVVYYDQRREPVPHSRHVADLDEVRQALGVERIDLLGFSWGAVLAVLYALEHPSRVARLVLVSILPLHPGAADEIGRRVEAATRRPAMRAIDRDDAFVKRVAPFLFAPERAHLLTSVEVDDEVARAAWKELATMDLRPRLRELRHLPALVVHGAEDPIPLATARETAELLAAELVVMEQCGHAPFFEATDRFMPLVARFLDAPLPD